MFRKNNSEDFKFPIQGSGSEKPGDMSTIYSSSVSVHDQSFLARNYIPYRVDTLSGRELLKQLLKRLKNKIY